MNDESVITSFRDHNGLEVLDREDCLALLRSVPIGRVAVTLNALPVILPVTFAVADDDRIVFRTGDGQKLRAALDGAVIAFEVDGFDEATRTGWSVLVQDRVRIATPDEARSYAAFQPEPWVGIDAPEIVVLGTALISGRRLDPTPG